MENMKFRPLKRQSGLLPQDLCAEILRTEKRGVLSVIGDGGYPYAMPMNFHCGDDGCIYFHCGKSGHRLDSVKKCQKASFCVYTSGEKSGDFWGLRVKSVVVFGRIEIIDDPRTAEEISRLLSYRFTSDDSYIEKEIRTHLHRTLILKLTPENICGKEVLEA